MYIYIYIKLSELHELCESNLKCLIANEINKTRLKNQILEHFLGVCQEQSDCKNTLVVFNKGLRQQLKDIVDEHDLEADMNDLEEFIYKVYRQFPGRLLRIRFLKVWTSGIDVALHEIRVANR